MRQQQLIREARWAVWLSILYLIAWGGLAYFLPLDTGILGFPIWFELSCIFLPFIFTLIVYAVIKTVYQEINLEEHTDE